MNHIQHDEIKMVPWRHDDDRYRTAEIWCAAFDRVFPRVILGCLVFVAVVVVAFWHIPERRVVVVPGGSSTQSTRSCSQTAITHDPRTATRYVIRRVGCGEEMGAPDTLSRTPWTWNKAP